MVILYTYLHRLSLRACFCISGALRARHVPTKSATATTSCQSFCRHHRAFASRKVIPAYPWRRWFLLWLAEQSRIRLLDVEVVWLAEFRRNAC